MSGPRRSFWSRLGFGSVPGDVEEGRAFLQRRIAFFIGALSLLWIFLGLTSTVSALLYMPEAVSGPGSSRAGGLHLLGTVALILVWAVVRRGRWSLAALNWFDAGVVIGQTVLVALVMDAVDIRFRPDMSITMGFSCTIIGRAAVVPSNGARTGLLGVVAALMIFAATIYTHLHLAPGSFMPPVVAATQIGMWLSFAVLLSTAISRIIYGLSLKVQEAARLGQYTLERKIGEGAMGVVYLARHALLRRPTAIKLLSPGRGGQTDLERFEREVQTTSALRHPNTVAIYDYGRTPEGIFYYAMEYLDGVDLEQLVAREGTLPEGRVVHILTQICGALEEAHAAGLIHRDIKPSNVLLCDHGHQPDFAKVLDFGLVKDASAEAGSSLSGVQTLTGTPLYMSPEAITTPSKLDGRSDLYALGAVAYTLLTGGPPFAGRTAVEVCGHHLHTPVEPPSQRRGRPVTPALEALVLACLAKDRAARPAGAAEVATRLAACPVPPWTVADARAWWDGPGAALRAARSAQPRAGLSDTVIIDLAARP
jgi:serine/threonine-protein kinase